MFSSHRVDVTFLDKCEFPMRAKGWSGSCGQAFNWAEYYDLNHTESARSPHAWLNQTSMQVVLRRIPLIVRRHVFESDHSPVGSRDHLPRIQCRAQRSRIRGNDGPKVPSSGSCEDLIWSGTTDVSSGWSFHPLIVPWASFEQTSGLDWAKSSWEVPVLTRSAFRRSLLANGIWTISGKRKHT